MAGLDIDTGHVRELAVIPVSALLTVGVAVALTRVRPSIGWPVLFGVTGLTAVGTLILGEDLRAEHATARASTGGDWTDDEQHAANRNLRPNEGAVTRFCMWAAGSGILYLFAWAFYLR